ncbi:hypothetical protein SAMN02949497_2414 [Methylomagnum ishizawai]|uniref:Lipocalin-like domain-containing protein n=1 Tax=Methylomagnum ishizawai TaxID=1760988 RepID=A0A1Y6CXU5_9GAMM|nr:hypothetical protein [Methylomagnum ishizawai]SMF95070.1 hypothetical protein SAMN02949497_2414 [Methylomagnum ishizawai]
MSKRFIPVFMALALALLPPVQAGAAGVKNDVAGQWSLVYTPRPKLKVSAFGQPVRGRFQLPQLPKTDAVTFTPDPAFPGTGQFATQLFSGVWKQSGAKVKGTPTQTVIESMLAGYLQQGSLYGVSFSGGTLVSAKNQLTAVVQKNGRLTGTFLHVSTWRIAVTQPQAMTVPLRIKLLAHFKGKR